jgi:predicted unusual protein kinase regulating ubiquinone biosynthesis (AarF/ABC1/UbiB family)
MKPFSEKTVYGELVKTDVSSEPPRDVADASSVDDALLARDSTEYLLTETALPAAADEAGWALSETLPKPGWVAVVLRTIRISGGIIGFFFHKYWAGRVSRRLGEGADKSRLDREAGERLARMLERFGGAAVKIGQQMSMRRDMLPKAYCDALDRFLDDVAEGIDPAKVRQIVGGTLRANQKLLDRRLLPEGCSDEMALSAVFRSFDAENPVGKASIACVYRAVLHSGEKVVVKVKRPDVAHKIAVDLEVLDYVCRALEFLTIVWPGWTETFREQLRSMLSEELDFRKEIRYQELFRLYHRRRGKYRISAPKVYYPYSGKQVIVAEFIEGVSVRDLQAALDQRDEATLELLARLNIDRKVLAKHLIRASFYAFFECPFFHGDPHQGNILVQPDNRIYLVDFGACGVFAEKERKILRQLHHFKSKGDVGGMVQCVIKLAEPIPPIDVLSFTKDLENVWWHGLYGVESKHPEWWERTSVRLWAGLLDLTRDCHIPMPLNMLRMIRATLLYDTVAARLHPKIDVFREYRKYHEDYAERVKCKMLRSVFRQSLMGPDPSHFVRAQEAMETANLAMFRFRQFLDAPFPEFQALADKIWTFIRELCLVFVNATVVTSVTWTVLAYLQPPSKPWMEAPVYFLREKGFSSGKAVMISWVLLMFVGVWHFYRLLRPRFSLEENKRRR